MGDKKAEWQKSDAPLYAQTWVEPRTGDVISIRARMKWFKAGEASGLPTQSGQEVPVTGIRTECQDR